MKTPPVRVVQAANAARTMLQAVVRRMVPPEVALLELASGFMATQAVYAAARLGVADALASGPLSADAVAAKIGSPTDTTYRLLRACAAFGIFREGSTGCFELTTMGMRLRSGTHESMLPVILMLGHPSYQGTWGQLAKVVQTGQPGAEGVLGQNLWDYLDADREFAATFDDAMTRLSALDWPSVDAAYDFTTFSTIVDIGGGQGQLLSLVLQAATSARGVLLERPALVRKAEDHLREAGVLSRCRVESGSFFETAPSDGDLYLMRRVIHDFSDEQAAAILSNVRDHMPSGATLLLLESVVPPGNTSHFAKSLDLDMMVFVDGRERTEREFVALLARVGLPVTRVVPTISTLSLIEAVAGRKP